jgi:hypothetical protein
MPISDKLIDQLLEGCSSPEDILGESGLLRDNKGQQGHPVRRDKSARDWR